MIRDWVGRGSKILVGAVIVASLVAAFVIQQVRFGGPISAKHALQGELLADILPPPAFVVEPYLHATMAAAGLESPEKARSALEQGYAEFAARKAYWDKAPLTADLRRKTLESNARAQAFWDGIQSHFIPALKAGKPDGNATHQRG